MRFFRLPAATAGGFATLYLAVLIAPLISPSHDVVYHLAGSAESVFVPVLTTFIALWLVLWGLVAFAQNDDRVGVAIWAGLLLWLPWILAKSTFVLLERPLPHFLSLGLFVSAGALFVAINVFWHGFFQRRLRIIREPACELMSFIGLTGLVCLMQLGWFGWQARNLNQERPLHRQSITASHQQQTRIIWIVLDELSYQQVYERRFRGLELPAFDKLAAESTVFTHVQPAGIYTEYVLPAYFTGEPVNELKTTTSGALVSLHDPVGGTWRDFNPRQTVFQDALTHGYSTGVVGWFNPYCRILAEALDHCFWTSHRFNPGELSEDEPITTNLAKPLRDITNAILPFIFPSRFKKRDRLLDVQMHANDYKALANESDTYLRDSSINFLLLHMPVPHPGGFYDRRTGTFAADHTSYIDNLALADLYLGHVRDVLVAQNEWDNATVLVMGDHSWRTSFVWRGLSNWTKEDEEASHGGQFDDRPGYIVKLPYQHEGVRIDEPFEALRTRALLDALMSGQIRTQQDLGGWVEAPSPLSRSVGALR